jgi:transcriptional regulator with XRE-family HTH domain
MARQRTDERTQQLLKQMGKTRADARTAVERLRITKKDLAAAAGWNAGYISDFLKETSGKNPTEDKMVGLIQALGGFAKTADGIAPADVEEVNQAVDRLRERYGVTQQTLVDPASGPIGGQAINYCERAAVDGEIARPAPAPGFWVAEGRPMSGVTSALLQVRQQALDRGLSVIMRSMLDDAIATDRREQSATKIIGALAAGVMKDDELLDDPTLANVQEVLADYLLRVTVEGEAKGLVLILDDIDVLSPEDASALKATFRDWSRRQAIGEEPFSTLTVWLAYTSKIVDARSVSHFQGRGLFVDWFSVPEVRSLAQAVRTAGAGATPDHRDDPASLAHRAFRGQPHLTHLYLWDHARGSGFDPLEHTPRGAYETHLERLARVARVRLSHEALMSLVEDDSPRPLPLGEFREATRLGLLAEPGDPDYPEWSSPYYAIHARSAIQALVET